MTTRVLSISTLFPTGAKPRFGQFVARQFEALVERKDIDLTVINPVAAMPWSIGGMIGWLSCACRSEHAHAVHHVPFARIPVLGPRANPWLIARTVMPLARKLHANRPFDVVDAQFFYPDGPAAARVADALGLPLTIKARGSDIHYWGRQPFALPQMLAAAQQTVGMLAVSAALKAEMVGLGMPEGKIAVHYTGLDHDLFKLQPRSNARGYMSMGKGIPGDGALLVCVGNLIPLKGQALVVDALSELPDTRLLLAGDGPDLASLRAHASRLGLSDRVHFASLAPFELAFALSAADAMVLPSESEGLANAWIEALASGTPLIVTDVGGAREVLRTPEAGRLVERNGKAIAAAVRDLLSKVPDREAIAAHAARFSWEANAAQLAEHYRRVAGAAPPSRASRS